MEILAGLTVMQIYLSLWILAIALGALVVFYERSLRGLLIGLSVATAVFAGGCFAAAMHVLTHPADARWLPADYVGPTPPDLSRMKDVPFLGDLAANLEGWLTESVQHLQSAVAIVHAGRVAGDFAQSGLIAAAAFLVLVLGLLFELLRAHRRTRRFNLERMDRLEREVLELRQRAGLS